MGKHKTPPGLIRMAHLDELKHINIGGESFVETIAEANMLSVGNTQHIVWSYPTHELYRDSNDHIAKDAIEKLKGSLDLYTILIKTYHIQPKNDNPETNMDFLLGTPTVNVGVDIHNRILVYGKDFVFEDGKVVYNDSSAVRDMQIEGKSPIKLGKLKWMSSGEGPCKNEKDNFYQAALKIASVRNGLLPEVKKYFDKYLNNKFFDKQDPVSSDKIVEKG